MITDLGMMNENSYLQTMLEFIDISMPINLLADYTTFPGKNEFENHENKREWLVKTDAGYAKYMKLRHLQV